MADVCFDFGNCLGICPVFPLVFSEKEEDKRGTHPNKSVTHPNKSVSVKD